MYVFQIHRQGSGLSLAIQIYEISQESGGLALPKLIWEWQPIGLEEDEAEHAAYLAELMGATAPSRPATDSFEISDPGELESQLKELMESGGMTRPKILDIVCMEAMLHVYAFIDEADGLPATGLDGSYL